MLGIITLFISRFGGKWLKYAFILVALAGAFFYIRNMGVQSERAVWEKASRIEQARQENVNEVWVKKSAVDADRITEQGERLERLHEQASTGADNEDTRDDIGLSADAVMRLNALR